MRIGLGIVVFVASALLIFWTHRSGAFSTSDLFLNLATEFLGIVVTLVLIDFILERRTQAQEARKTATRALNDVDHAIWVWLGGLRAFELQETVELLEKVDDSAILAPFTQNLFLQLGTTASYTLKLETAQLQRNKYLRESLERLSDLMAVRDQNSQLSPEVLSSLLKEVVKNLATAARVSSTQGTFDASTVHYNPSLEEQEWRHYGEVIGRAT
jgi:hypothetical protein